MAVSFIGRAVSNVQLFDPRLAICVVKGWLLPGATGRILTEHQTYVESNERQNKSIEEEKAIDERLLSG